MYSWIRISAHHKTVTHSCVFIRIPVLSPTINRTQYNLKLKMKTAFATAITMLFSLSLPIGNSSSLWSMFQPAPNAPMTAEDCIQELKKVVELNKGYKLNNDGLKQNLQEITNDDFDDYSSYLQQISDDDIKSRFTTNRQRFMKALESLRGVYPFIDASKTKHRQNHVIEPAKPIWYLGHKVDDLSNLLDVEYLTPKQADEYYTLLHNFRNSDLSKTNIGAILSYKEIKELINTLESKWCTQCKRPIGQFQMNHPKDNTRYWWNIPGHLEDRYPNACRNMAHLLNQGAFAATGESLMSEIDDPSSFGMDNYDEHNMPLDEFGFGEADGFTPLIQSAIS